MEIEFKLCDTYAMQEETFAAFVRRNRKARKWSQRDLGEAVGISDRRISDWENDRGYPDRDSIGQLAVVFNVSTDEIMRLLPEVYRPVVAPTPSDPFDAIVNELPLDANPDEAALAVERVLDAIDADERRAIIQGLKDWFAGRRGARRSGIGPRSQLSA